MNDFPYRVADDEIEALAGRLQKVDVSNRDLLDGAKPFSRRGCTRRIELDSDDYRNGPTSCCTDSEHAGDELAIATTRIEYPCGCTGGALGKELSHHEIHDVVWSRNKALHEFLIASR